ncbi:metallophosphoesterase family protein [Brumimicrobium aurantiacum]|uniref:DNA repair exonuclease n=1 Tax=Brumimicrobium aurantiacum TaxID=1737063 RepID=A0A3E1EYI9_9FLAO|nr:DNA repair exonuclease [Brumimicrobium aurantiacum]RFC54597.1 DNA repair exonuclease [Brumimicrobium aurantiacum]
MAISILVTGDIHIGKKSTGINTDSNVLATKFTWQKIVDYVIKNKIDVLALTGDVVDQNNRFFEAIGPLHAGFEKLKNEGIEVFMVAGNHDFDVLPQLVDSDRYENIHLLGKDGTWEVKEYAKNEEKIQFVGWSFPSKHFAESPFLKYKLDQVNITLPTIGLLHGDVDVPESSYAPIDKSSFNNKNVNAWFLGHIHKPDCLRDFNPMVYYPGSPHALSAKETGIHGPMLVTVNSQNSIETKAIPLSPVRYKSIDIDVTDQTTEADVRNVMTSTLYADANAKINELENTSFLVYDIYFVGQHNNIQDLKNWTEPSIESYSQEINETKISIRKIKYHVKPKIDNLEELALESSPAGILAKTIVALEKGETTPFSDKLLEKWKKIHQKTYQSSVYNPIIESENVKSPDTEIQNQYLLTECNRILTTLIEQQNQ